MNRNGFTLIEMLIALTIFGMLAAAGVSLLNVTARTQETADRLLAEVSALRRTTALLTADLAQAAPRIFRDAEGRSHQAFSGEAGDRPMLLLVVRRGWDRGNGPEPQRVAYRLNEGRLERLSFARIDGGASAVAVVLIEGVRAARLRYRDREGEWRNRWDPTDAASLPVAVELVTESDDFGLLQQRFLVGAPI